MMNNKFNWFIFKLEKYYYKFIYYLTVQKPKFALDFYI